MSWHLSDQQIQLIRRCYHEYAAKRACLSANNAVQDNDAHRCERSCETAVVENVAICVHSGRLHVCDRGRPTIEGPSRCPYEYGDSSEGLRTCLLTGLSRYEPSHEPAWNETPQQPDRREDRKLPDAYKWRSLAQATVNKLLTSDIRRSVNTSIIDEQLKILHESIRRHVQERAKCHKFVFVAHIYGLIDNTLRTLGNENAYSRVLSTQEQHDIVNVICNTNHLFHEHNSFAYRNQYSFVLHTLACLYTLAEGKMEPYLPRHELLFKLLPRPKTLPRFKYSRRAVSKAKILFRQQLIDAFESDSQYVRRAVQQIANYCRSNSATGVNG